MNKVLVTIFTLAAFCFALCQTGTALAADPTTEIHVVKYASDGTTVVDEMTVDYLWMEANLPVQGDGVTHYYHQGPVFDETMDKWDPEETENFKDKGAARGTDIKDLCDLVGGMSPDDKVIICAVDGYCINFSYQNVYQPQDRQGPIVLCWYKVDEGAPGQYQESGYPPRYFEAMQLVFMPKTKNNEGLYVFGNWDMHECLPEMSVHFYSDGSQLYPSTNGLSVKWIGSVSVYPEDAPITAPVTPAYSAAKNETSSTSPLIIGLSVAVAVVVLLAVAIMFRRKRS